jgi:aromatic-L-amino-acid decarboxylase
MQRSTEETGMSDRNGLEPDAPTRRAWLDEMRKLAEDRGHSSPGGSEPVCPRIQETPLADGMQAALDYVAHAAKDALDTTAAGFMAYVPGGGLFATAVADFAADVFNRYTGLAEAAPAFRRLEQDVLEWMANSFGYGREAHGSFTSGGSLATFAAVVCARESARSREDDLRRLVGYVSSEAHSSVASAFRLAGLESGNLRQVPTDASFRLRPDELREIISEDRAKRLVPFMVVATAGTTNTGAIDPLRQIATVAEEENLWMHTDAAYGGAFVLCAEGKRRLAGIERSHSIVVDPHKGMFLPYGTGCLLFRNGTLLPARWAGNAPYLRDLQSDELDQRGGPGDFQLELTRPFRGLRVWLPLIVHGAGAFRAALEEKLDLARLLHERLGGLAKEGYPLEIVTPPQLSIVPFRLRRRLGEHIEAWNGRTRILLDRINASKRTILSSTLLPHDDARVAAIRACVLSYRTHAGDIENCVEDIRRAFHGMDGFDSDTGAALVV